MAKDFGIYPEHVTPRQWWGARALLEKGRDGWKFCLLYDRQSYERNETVTETDHDDFFFWLSHEMDSALQKRVHDDYRFRTENTLFTLDSESGRFHCEARTKNSGGYLYIGAWEA